VFKDDRLISVMSGVILMVAVGTVVQRGDAVMSYLGMGETAPILNPDSVTTMANDLVRIEVLSNDEHLMRGASEVLEVATHPACGRVFVQGGALQYLPITGCEGQQVVEYRLAGVSTVNYGEVIVTVTPAPEALNADRKAPVPSAPEAPEIALNSPSVSAPKAHQPADTLVAPSLASSGIAPETTSVSQPTARTAPGISAPSMQPGAEIGSIGGVGSPSIAAPRPEDSQIALSQPLQQPTIDTAEIEAPSLPPIKEQVPTEVAAQPVPQIAEDWGEDVAADQSPQIAAIAAPGSGAAQPVRRTTAEPLVAATLSLARISHGVTVDQAPAAPQIDLGPGLLGNAAPQTELLEIDSSGSDRIARLDPESGLGPVRELGRGIEAAPMNRVEPAALSVPTLEADGDAGRLAALDPTAPITPGEETAATEPEIAIDPDQPATQPATHAEIPMDPDQPATVASIPMDPDQPATDAIPMDPDQPATAEIPMDPDQPATQQVPITPDIVAALPEASDACAAPPGITLDTQPAGRTVITIDSPCHAGRAVELRYSGMALGIPIGPNGEGEVIVPGFEPSSGALLIFPDGAEIPFDLPFEGLERVHRVALIWDLPVNLELHAQEFGAQIGSNGHVRPDNPRSYDVVRSTGGGYLDRFRPVGRVGQNVRVYSFLNRPGGGTGVVTLAVDFASRHNGGSAETCGSGALAAPSFTVLRSAGGEIESSSTSRIGAINCQRAANMTSYLIGDAVKNMIISRR